MAGVAGVRHFTDADHHRRLIPSMLTVMGHRYRAGAEPWTSGPIELAIANDPRSPRPPAFVTPPTSRCGRFICAFDGVLTNRALLRERVASSWCRVRNPQDAELLLEHISVFGVGETLQRIDGAFALAIWDHHARTLTLARDRFGLRSLFHRMNRFPDGRPSHLSFASEAKALGNTIDPAVHGGNAPLSMPAAHRLLLARLGNVSFPAASAQEGEAAPVLPGHSVTFGEDGVRIDEMIADLGGLLNDSAHRAELRMIAPSDRIGRIIDACTRSIRAQTDGADHVLCLTGGDLASAVLASLAVRIGISVRLLHVDTGCPQRRQACTMLADRLGAPLTMMRTTDASVRANLVEATWHLESPLPARSSAIPLYQACHRAAALRADVVLHGCGGHHLFGRPFSALRRGLTSFITAARDRIPEATTPRLIHALFNRSGAAAHSLFSRVTHRLHGAEASACDHHSGGAPCATDLQTFLRGRLERAERMSAAWGVELRTPFLTEETISIAGALPPALRMPGPSFLRSPRAALGALSPLGQIAATLLSPDIIAQCTASTPDLPDVHLPVDPDFIESGAVMSWLGCPDRAHLDMLLDELPAADRQELLLCDIWMRLFMQGVPCEDVTRALLGHQLPIATETRETASGTSDAASPPPAQGTPHGAASSPPERAAA